MKRSEMINQLAGYLSTYHWYEEKHPEELIGLANEALNGVEKLGMLPPEIPHPDPYYGHPESIFINEWEPE